MSAGSPLTLGGYPVKATHETYCDCGCLCGLGPLEELRNTKAAFTQALSEFKQDPSNLDCLLRLLSISCAPEVHGELQKIGGPLVMQAKESGAEFSQTASMLLECVAMEFSKSPNYSLSFEERSEARDAIFTYLRARVLPLVIEVMNHILVEKAQYQESLNIPFARSVGELRSYQSMLIALQPYLSEEDRKNKVFYHEFSDGVHAGCSPLEMERIKHPVDDVIQKVKARLNEIEQLFVELQNEEASLKGYSNQEAVSRLNEVSRQKTALSHEQRDLLELKGTLIPQASLSVLEQEVAEDQSLCEENFRFLVEIERATDASEKAWHQIQKTHIQMNLAQTPEEYGQLTTQMSSLQKQQADWNNQADLLHHKLRTLERRARPLEAVLKQAYDLLRHTELEVLTDSDLARRIQSFLRLAAFFSAVHSTGVVIEKLVLTKGSTLAFNNISSLLGRINDQRKEIHASGKDQETKEMELSQLQQGTQKIMEMVQERKLLMTKHVPQELELTEFQEELFFISVNGFGAIRAGLESALMPFDRTKSIALLLSASRLHRPQMVQQILENKGINIDGLHYQTYEEDEAASEGAAAAIVDNSFAERASIVAGITQDLERQAYSAFDKVSDSQIILLIQEMTFMQLNEIHGQLANVARQGLENMNLSEADKSAAKSVFVIASEIGSMIRNPHIQNQIMWRLSMVVNDWKKRLDDLLPKPLVTIGLDKAASAIEELMSDLTTQNKLADAFANLGK